MGQRYDHVKKVYSINVIYFNLGHGSDYLYHGTNQFVGVNTGDTLMINEKESRGFSQPKNTNVFPEYYIIRVNQFDKKEIVTPLDEWMRYLQTGYIKPDTSVPGLQKAREKLRVLSMSDEDRKEYEYYLYNKVYEEDLVETARWDGRKEGLEEGLEEGRRASMEEVAKRLKAMGMDDDTIAKVTR
jgi:predicted transposase/invertase (TIGR01784 family)